jgi:hypothetical protein
MPRLAPWQSLITSWQVINFLSRNPYKVIHDLRLYLHPAILDQLNDLLGVILFQPFLTETSFFTTFRWDMHPW